MATSSTDSCPPSILYPLSQVLSYSNLSPCHKNFVLAISSTKEPKTYAQAVQFECWRKAMDDEIEALVKTGT